MTRAKMGLLILILCMTVALPRPDCASENPNGAKIASTATENRIGDGIPDGKFLTPIPIPGGISDTTTVASDNGLIYELATSAETPRVTQFWFYDPTSDTWTQVADIPVEPWIRVRSSAVQLGGRVYVFGGHDGTGVLNTLWIYDIAENVWTRGADMPGPRFSAAVAALGGQIIVAGGFDESSRFSDTWLYDQTKDSYSTLAPLPTALGGIRGVGMEKLGQMHVFGGGFETRVHLVYNLEVDAWSGAPPLPFPVSELAVVTDDTLIYVLGIGGRPEGRIQVFDPLAGIWSLGPLLLPPLDNLSGALVGDTIYLEGGSREPFNRALRLPR